MNASKLTIAAVAVLVITVIVPAANAQQYYQNQQNYGNYGNQQTTNWQVQQGINVQNPGAMIAGGLLQGLGRGLAAQNPQQNAVASGILTGLGQGLTVASQPSVWQQGRIQTTNQGYYNNGSNQQWGRVPSRPAPRYPVHNNYRYR